MDLLTLLVAIAGGVAGGLAMVAIVSPIGRGPLGNVLTGLVGGSLGGQIVERSMGMLPPGAESAALDTGALLTAVAGGVLGGSALALLAGGISRLFER